MLALVSVFSCLLDFTPHFVLYILVISEMNATLSFAST